MNKLFAFLSYQTNFSYFLLRLIKRNVLQKYFVSRKITSYCLSEKFATVMTFHCKKKKKEPCNLKFVDVMVFNL